MKKHFYFNGVIIGLGTIGLIINTLQSDNIIESFSYYTTQSNLLIVIFFIYISIKEIIKNPVTATDHVIKGMLTVNIILTMVVYHFMLRPLIANIDPAVYEVGSLRDMIMHYIVPLMVLGHWLIFNLKKHYHPTYPLLWIMQPVLYLTYTTGYITLGGQYHYGDAYHNYPYFFLDYQTHGFLIVSLYALLILSTVITLGYSLYGLQKLYHKVSSG